MIKIYLLFLFICLSLHSYSQTPSIETVGKPDSTTPVSLYTGWANQGVLTYTGNAAVQDSMPSDDYPYASGGSNVFFTNIPGTYFQISGFHTYGSTPPVGSVDIGFNVFGYNTEDSKNLDDLSLSISTDSGSTWSSVHHTQFATFMGSSWGYMYDDPADDSAFYATAKYPLDLNKVMFRFTQTSSIKTFRIDDIQLHFYILLPITLQSFTATTNGGKTIISWHATSSSNKELFVVEKSNDGVNFYSLSQQYAKGNGDYTYTTNDELNKSKAFYRLNMISAEGKSSYSGLVIVSPQTNSKELIQIVYPVPAKEILHIQVNHTKEEQAMLSLTDLQGKQLLHKTLFIKQGTNDYNVNIESLQTGSYFITITTAEQTETRKIIIYSHR